MAFRNFIMFRKNNNSDDEDEWDNSPPKQKALQLKKRAKKRRHYKRPVKKSRSNASRSNHVENMNKINKVPKAKRKYLYESYFMPKENRHTLAKSPDVGLHLLACLLQPKEKSTTTIDAAQAEEEDAKMCESLAKNIEDNFKFPNEQLKEVMDGEIKDQVKFSTMLCEDVDQMCKMFDNLLDE